MLAPPLGGLSLPGSLSLDDASDASSSGSTLEDVLSSSLPPPYIRLDQYPSPRSPAPLRVALLRFLRGEYTRAASNASRARLERALDNVLTCLLGRGLATYTHGHGHKGAIDPFCALASPELLRMVGVMGHNVMGDGGEITLWHVLAGVPGRWRVQLEGCWLGGRARELSLSCEEVVKLSLPAPDSNEETGAPGHVKTLLGFHHAFPPTPQANGQPPPPPPYVGFAAPVVPSMVAGQSGYEELLAAFRRSQNPSAPAPPAPPAGAAAVAPVQPYANMGAEEYFLYSFLSVAVRGYSEFRASPAAAAAPRTPGSPHAPPSPANAAPPSPTSPAPYLTVLSQYLQHYLTGASSKPSLFAPLLLDIFLHQSPLVPPSSLSRAALLKHLHKHQQAHPNQPLSTHPPPPLLAPCKHAPAFPSATFPHGLYADSLSLLLSQLSHLSLPSPSPLLLSFHASLYPFLANGLSEASPYVVPRTANPGARFVLPQPPDREAPLKTFISLWLRFLQVSSWGRGGGEREVR